MPHKDPEKIKEYYQKNKEKRIEQAVEWNKVHKEAHRAAQAKYRETHREELRQKGREYAARVQKEHPEVVKERRDRTYKTKNGLAGHRYRGYRRIDTGKGFPLDNLITKQWIVDNIFSGQSCVYCGESDWHKLGTDRIDNTKGHTPDNCLPCCDRCNETRSNKSFFAFAKNFPGSTAMILRNMWAIENAKRLAMSQPLIMTKM